MSDEATTATLVCAVRHDAVSVLTLNRPQRLNALSSDLAAELAAAVRDAADDPGVRALVISGAGRGFCAGADLGEIESCDSPYQFRAFVRRLTDTFGLIEGLAKPSVAALHGFALGGGLELALACDLRVAEEGARLGLPEMKLGVLPGAGGTQRLPRLIAPGVARQMVLTGEPISAERGHQLGLVNELAPVGGALSAAIELAAVLAAGAPLALEAGKRLLAQGPGMEPSAAIDYERETVSVLFSSWDRAEGLAAFRERRPGRFTGC